MEMESCSHPDCKMSAHIWFIITFKSVIQSGSGLTEVVDPVERISHVQTGAIFVPARICTVVIRHHVSTVKKAIVNAHIPFSHVQVELARSRKYIMSDKDPVMLHSLEVSQTEGELLHVHS